MNEQQLFLMIGEINANVENIKDRLEKLEKETAINTETLNQAKGGWRTLLLIGGAASLAGSVLTQIAQGMFK